MFKHSAVQCPTRPGHVYVNGTCVADPSFTPSGGGVVMIGDSLKTDLAGARDYGIDALFIARGIHRADMTGDEDAAAIAALFEKAGAQAIGAMTELRW